MLFDTHIHLDQPPLIQDLEGELRDARRSGVERFLLPGISSAGWPALLATAASVEGAVAAPGLHPMAAGEWSAEVASELEKLLRSPGVAAVGEIGLDALLPAPSFEIQEAAFRGQLRLAVGIGLPVLIHCRRASGRLLRILAEEDARRVGGILHGFSGSVETALEGVKLGFAIGFGGPLTFPNARRAVEVLRSLPEESVVLETDAPDLAPHPYRGEVNRPAHLPLIARRVGEIRGWSEERTARLTTRNAFRVLKLHG